MFVSLTCLAAMALGLNSVLSQYLLIFSATLAAVLIVFRWYKNRNLPPGPIGLPLFGYIPFLGNEPHKKLRDLSKKYGSVFSIYFGPSYTVIVSDYEVAKDVLSNPVNLTRPLNAFDTVPGRAGFGSANGEEWQEQRRFSLYTMRNLGLGKGLWESLMQQDADDFVAEVKTWDGKARDFIDPLSLSQCSSLIALLTGKRLPKNMHDPEVLLTLKAALIIVDFFNPLKMSVVAPHISKYLIKFGLSGYGDALKDLQAFGGIIGKEVINRMSSNEKSHVQDFIGSYLDEMEKVNTSEKTHYFSIENLIGNILLLFVAGMDSTLTSMNWLLRLMAAYPEIQKKVHKEIDEVFGRDGQAYWDDRNKLPYTIANIMEMQRWVTISPILPARLVTETIEVKGYTIPKGSRIVTNMWAIMHDPKYHKKPCEYIPERFLEDNGRRIAKLDAYLPFSFGKRNCPGETVATMSIYLYFVAVMQKFKVTAPDGQKIDLEPQFSTAMRPKRIQKLHFIER